MSINEKSVNEKLAKLDEVINLLKEYRKSSYEKFVSDQTIQGATMFNMIIGVEVIIDIGMHILSAIYHTTAREYKEVIEKLGEYEIVPEEFAKENANMAKFRNLVVHEYGAVKLDQVYENLQKAPDIFRQFAKYYVEFLENSLNHTEQD